MGGGSAKAHQSFAVTPAGAGFTPWAATLGGLAGLQAPTPETSVEAYEAFAAQVTKAQEAIEASTATPEEKAAATQILAEATTAWLSSLDHQTLMKMAAEAGFNHPSLVGFNRTDPHPLAQWLNPTVPLDVKTAIQAKAEQRYEQLLAGDTVHGLTLADVGATDAALLEQTTPAPQAAPTETGTAATPDQNAGAAPPALSDWLGKHRALVDALKHHAASVEHLPERLPAGEVAGWEFTPAHEPVGLGGVHTQSIWHAPDGSAWMFKPDNSAGGARAHAEAAASAVLARAGVPAVPVYVKELGGKVGSIQPLVTDAAALDPNPKSWSQADVDAMVRYHVAAWMVADHDGKPDNILRTKNGGVVPIDGGQAFKFFGQDKLSLDYHPNSSAGASPPVHQLAFQAAKAGKLAPGVKVRPEVALGTIKALEAIPDAEYRGMLTQTAYEGANNPKGTVWAKTMRKVAAKNLGKPSDQVTPTEVAETFLDYAVLRKQTLKPTFTGFYMQAGFDGADKLLKAS